MCGACGGVGQMNPAWLAEVERWCDVMYTKADDPAQVRPRAPALRASLRPAAYFNAPYTVQRDAAVAPAVCPRCLRAAVAVGAAQGNVLREGGDVSWS